MKDSIIMKDNLCPYCGNHTDRAMDMSNEGDTPSPECLSVCIRCGEIGIFDEYLTIQKFDINLLDKAQKYEMRKIQLAIAKARLEVESEETIQ